jgi:hypothetical protein
MALSELFEKAKTDAQKVPISELKSLVESGKTSPLAAKRSFRPRRITSKLFNPLKILVMITIIGIISTALIFLNITTSQAPTGERIQISDDAASRSINPREKTNQGSAGVIEPEHPTNDKTSPNAKSLGVQVASSNPMDHDTVFKGIILDLSKEELTRLGFMFDEEGFYYLNKLPNGSLVNLWSWKKGNIGSGDFLETPFPCRDNKQAETSFDFYPVVLSETDGQDPRGPGRASRYFWESFGLENDTLVPVLFRAKEFLGSYATDLLIWFKPSEAFFDLIHSEQGEYCMRTIREVKELESRFSGMNDRVIYGFRDESVTPGLQPELVKPIKLSAETLACMGFKVTAESIGYQYSAGGEFLTTWVWGQGIGIRRHFNVVDSLLFTSRKVRLYFITRAEKNQKNHPIGGVYGNRKQFQEQLELCVPIQLGDTTRPEFVRNTIFWIYPDDLFFECLPAEIAGPMMREFNYQAKRLDPDFVPLMGGSIGINGGGLTIDTLKMGGSMGISGGDQKEGSLKEDVEPVPCVYFTSLCESLPGLDYINLYPNPATDQVSVDLGLQKAKVIRFRVVDLGGRVISEEGAAQNYPGGGKYTYLLDISKLQKGFYLLVITDEEGARLTRRFVKN